MGGTLGWGRFNNQIITDGLQLFLDAANYSGSGTIWPDASPYQRNATLFNTPTFNTGFGKYFNFAPASLEYATVPNIGSIPRWTAEVWMRTTASLTGVVTAVFCNQFNLTSSLNFSLGTNNAPGSYAIAAGYYNGAWRTVSGFTPALNTWYYIAGTYDGATVRFYVNGVENSTLAYVGTPTSGGELRIARRWDEAATASNFFPGDIGLVRLYNRALTAAEVQQNFTASRVRFGV